MRRTNLLLTVVCLAVLTWCFSLTSTTEQTALSPQRTEEESGSLVVSAPLKFGNLTVFPITSKSQKRQDRFTTLDEGLKAGTIEVFEVGADGNRIEDPVIQSNENRFANLVQQFASGGPGGGAEVNRLMVVNRSGKPLYLMPGEVIVGGRQDRSIAQETIIATGEKPVPIDVYCVEQGRWSQRGANAEAAAAYEALGQDANVNITAVTISSLARSADRGNFVLSAGSLNQRSRLAAQSGKNQEEIWNQVAKANRKLKVSGMSGAFTQNYVNAGVRKHLQPYIDTLRNPVSEQRKIVGVVVAINGKIAAVDVFESTPLFRKLWPKLLKSYALDAVASADDSTGVQRCTIAEARSFLEACPTAKVEERNRTTGGLIVTKRISDKGAVNFSFGRGMGGFGGGVHSAAFSK